MDAVYKLLKLDQRGNEDRLFVLMIIASIGFHFVIVLVSSMSYIFGPSTDRRIEWEIDTEIVSDFGVPAPKEEEIKVSSKDEKIPDVKEANQDAANLLPQITKNMVVKSETIEDSGEILTKNKLAEAKKIEDANALKKKDALKRLALERLRQKAQRASETQQKKDKALNQLKAKSAKDIKLSSTKVGLSASYRVRLRRHFLKCFSPPKAYNIQGQGLQSIVSIVMAKTGRVTESKLVKSSTHAVVDQLALDAITKCSPAPRPDLGLAGKRIQIVFSP